ncbi:MAG TPA: NADH-quinone oxidoreductase subunit L, partial [Candidatus Acidoferrum sp.]|nr:NADH-quinone oxidoreductase subunit L [Candidatus Acidoferrum sp.]
LIGFWYEKKVAADAGKKAFIVNRVGDFGFGLGIMLIWVTFGTLNYVEVFAKADASVSTNVYLAIALLLFMGACGKSAQLPLFTWLPDAMECPTPVSALIHAATMVTAGVYLLYRTAFLFEKTPDVLAAVGWIGAFTALLAATLACVQTDIKRVLAYSTVSQLGYMMAAIGAGFAGAGFLHLLTHGVFKALLFLAAGAVIHAVGTNDIFAMGGLARRMPQTFTVFLIGTLSLAGIPFFAGFFSKEEILGAAWAGGLAVPFGMLVLAAFLTAFYMFRVVFITFLGGPAAAPGHGEAHAHDAPVIMTLPLWILAALAMGIGIWFSVSHPEAGFAPPGWLTPLAIAVAVAGIALAWLVYGLRAISADRLFESFAWIGEAAVERFWLDDLFALVYRRVILRVSRATGWVDRYIVDGILNALSAWTLTAGDRLRRIQTGQAQDYVYGIALGVLLLMVWMRWPR